MPRLADGRRKLLAGGNSRKPDSCQNPAFPWVGMNAIHYEYLRSLEGSNSKSIEKCETVFGLMCFSMNFR